jgi:ADP-ribosylglycohydrolase
LSETLKQWSKKYPNAGYGGGFRDYFKKNIEYSSDKNGAAMRVSPVAWVADSLKEAQKLAKMSANVTHNHPEGIKGALATCDAIFLARTGSSKEEIKQHIENSRYGNSIIHNNNNNLMSSSIAPKMRGSSIGEDGLFEDALDT